MAVVVGKDPFGPRSEYFEGWMTNPVFMVRTVEVKDAAEAMLAARGRLLAVTDEGDEAEDWEIEQGSKFTAKYASPLYVTEGGLVMWLDVRGEMGLPMGNRMLAIVVEELEQRGVSAWIVNVGDRVPEDKWEYVPA